VFRSRFPPTPKSWLMLRPAPHGNSGWNWLGERTSQK